MERERRGSILGAVVLAIVGACLTSPIGGVIARRENLAFGMGLLLVAVALFPAAYLLTWLMGRDAGRLLDGIGERRRRVAALEARLAATPLPFECPPDVFAELVEHELEVLPGWVHGRIEEAAARVEVAEQLDGGPLVLGLYSRRPLTGPALVGGGNRVDVETVITLFRKPIVRAAGIPERLRTQVRETLLHEVGHLLGMDETDLDRYSIGNHPEPDATVVRPRLR